MSDEKTYRFISDPGHKENLSGRVRAACVTCRRKKIKCSGEVPCSTCEERGIVCEGLTDRKRPKRNLDKRSRVTSARDERRSSRDSPLDEGIARSQRSSFDSSSSRPACIDENLRRPTVQLRKTGTQSSEDSGYASGVHSSRESSTNLRLETRFPVNYRFNSSSESACEYANDVSPSTVDQSWTALSRPPSADVFSADGLSRIPQMSPTAGYINSVEWPDRNPRPNAWSDVSSNEQTTTTLLSAAQNLELQAMSLRKFASKNGQDSADGLRRQTIAFPIYDEGAVPVEGSNQLASSAFDDLSLIFGGRTSGTGFTPLPIEFNSYWDVNPSVSTALNFQANSMQSSAMANVSEEITTEWPDLSNLFMTSSAAGSGSAASNSTMLQEQSQAARQPATLFRTRPRPGYQQLYPWPE